MVSPLFGEKERPPSQKTQEFDGKMWERGRDELTAWVGNVSLGWFPFGFLLPPGSVPRSTTDPFYLPFPPFGVFGGVAVRHSVGSFLPPPQKLTTQLAMRSFLMVFAHLV